MEDLVLMTMTMDIEGDHHKPHNYLRIITNLVILSQDPSAQPWFSPSQSAGRRCV